ncbi:MAG: hypothetical protein ACR2LK_03590 [Solirubrobacteraceae bacterium]
MDRVAVSRRTLTLAGEEMIVHAKTTTGTWATRRVAIGVAVLALGLGGCGGDDESADKEATTTTQSARATTTEPEAVPAQKVPADIARDVDAVRAALKAAGFTVKQSKFPGKPLAQLEVGSTLVAFYASAAQADQSAAAIKRAFGGDSARGSVRASGQRLYTVVQQDGLSESARSRFSKIVSTSEGAL